MRKKVPERLQNDKENRERPETWRKKRPCDRQKVLKLFRRAAGFDRVFWRETAATIVGKRLWIRDQKRPLPGNWLIPDSKTVGQHPLTACTVPKARQAGNNKRAIDDSRRPLFTKNKRLLRLNNVQTDEQTPHPYRGVLSVTVLRNNGPQVVQLLGVEN